MCHFASRRQFDRILPGTSNVASLIDSGRYDSPVWGEKGEVVEGRIISHKPRRATHVAKRPGDQKRVWIPVQGSAGARLELEGRLAMLATTAGNHETVRGHYEPSESHYRESD
jgi:hypothetical protein